MGINERYLYLRDKLLLEGQKVGNTYELLNQKIQLSDINDNIAWVRGISPSYLLGELLWYYRSRNDLEFISKFSSFWKHLSDDGVTCNSAYGYLMQEGYGFNQIELVVRMLQEDPNSRRAVINLNVPNRNAIITRDEPCTICLQFLIRNKKLHCTAVMRSNDIWFGFPYDVAFFTDLQKYIAMKLGVDYGTYTHFVMSLHLYEKDVEKIKNLEAENHPKIQFNSAAFHALAEEAERVVMKSLNPKQDLVEFYIKYGGIKIENSH